MAGAGIVPTNQTSKPGDTPIRALSLGWKGVSWEQMGLVDSMIKMLNTIWVTLVWLTHTSVTTSCWNGCLKFQLQEVNTNYPWAVLPVKSGVTFVSRKTSRLLPFWTNHFGVNHMIIMCCRHCSWWRERCSVSPGWPSVVKDARFYLNPSNTSLYWMKSF